MEFVSDGCRDITGFDPADLVQNQTVSYRQLIYSKDRDMVREEIDRALRERRHYQISYRIQTRVGEEKWVWEQGAGFFAPSAAEATAVEGVIVDITPRRAVTKQIETQDRLANVGRMATGIAHDFNNIMSIITLYSGLLERQPDHPRRNQYLSVISQQAYHASRLIRQLLDYSRNSLVDQQALNLSTFLEEMVGLLQRTVPENVAVRLESSAEEALVRADPTRLQQVMINLAFNARDAMPNGGSLNVSLTRLELGSGEQLADVNLDPGHWLCIRVTDTGFGIPPHVLPRIFEPFYTTKEPGRGTGLGLAQVQGIVTELNGAIGVHSELGAGTTFSIYLPALAPVERPKAETETAAALDKHTETILLVDDNDATREAVTEVLAGLGYRVLVASTGKQALAHVEAHGANIDLLLADMIMPEIGGVELYERIRHQWSELPCILMSGQALDREQQRRLEDETIYWIQKPFTIDVLAESLRLVLGL
jgi:PAS domain S-box-containing protein